MKGDVIIMLASLSEIENSSSNSEEEDISVIKKIKNCSLEDDHNTFNNKLIKVFSI
jgi:hypothetical protein